MTLYFFRICNNRQVRLDERRKDIDQMIAWHIKLQEEEKRVARMEQTAYYKLVSATTKALSHNGL